MQLYEFDRHLKQTHNVKVLAGVDEAGRGPLAGPVVSAVVILNDQHTIDGLNDSKKLTASKRAEVYRAIISHAVAYSIGIAGHDEIDRLNILEATKLAMMRAIKELPIPPDLIVIDAISLKDLKAPQLSLVKADAKSASVASASIVAKYTRDSIMNDFHNQYPVYRFDLHKGYPTKLHLEMLKKHGPCPIHRKTFRYVSASLF